jgi:predicted acylesterase/phospholipase RssA
VVFGRPGSPRARLSEAVAASCAIPAYFSPVTIGTKQYVDGGVHSATNADVLGHACLDLVIVVAPMSAAHGPLEPRRRTDRVGRCTAASIERSAACATRAPR